MSIPSLKRGRYGLAPAIIAACLAVSGGCRTFCPKSLKHDVVTARQASLQGLDYMQQGRWDEAERTFAGAVKACPIDERARSCYAETLWQRGLRDQAISHMQEAVSLSSGDPQRLVRLGEMYLAVGNVAEAQTCADRAIEKNNRLSHAWALRGDALRRRGMLEEALCDYHKSLAFNRHQPRVQLAAAEIYQTQNRTQRALSTLETLVDQYPPGEVPANVLAMQGSSLLKMGRKHDAVEVLARAVEAETPSADLLCLFAQAKLQSGDHGAAHDALIAALAQDPQHREASTLRADLESRTQAMTARIDGASYR